MPLRNGRFQPGKAGDGVESSEDDTRRVFTILRCGINRRTLRLRRLHERAPVEPPVGDPLSVLTVRADPCLMACLTRGTGNLEDRK